jgi:hypothetical protein
LTMTIRAPGASRATSRRRTFDDSPLTLLEEAVNLVRATLGQIEAGEKPGIHVSMNELGHYNPQRIQRSAKGIFAGGHIYSVGSMKGMLEWYNQTKFTPEDLRRALRPGRNLVNCKVLISAARYILRQRGKP